MNHLRATIGISAAVVAFDQATKTVAHHPPLAQHLGVPRAPYNEGLSLQLIDTHRWAEVALMAIIAILGVLMARHFRLAPLPSGLLLGGAIGNLLDRLLLGAVRDFLPIGPLVINLADLAILAGIAAADLTRVARQPDLNARGAGRDPSTR